MLKSLENFFNSPGFETTDAQGLWASVAQMADVFANPPPFKSNTNQKAGLPFLEKGQAIEGPYLPISFLRDEAARFFAKEQVSKTFVSSGTTNAVRSSSLFSADGLLLYKACSLKTFQHVMQRFFGPRTMSIRGFSLIPDLDAWPNSSLAQMIAWIGEYWPTTYAKPESLAFSVDLQQPVWLFSTTYQLIELFENGFKTKLPAGSVVIETGGMKSLNRAISRAELFHRIFVHLGVSKDRIVSEYGMCELASQAYDWAPAANTKIEDRRFRFPSWVQSYAMEQLGSAKTNTKGNLLVSDPVRIDYPWPLRTQDLCSLAEDGSFTLDGRAVGAPLKGCSLTAEAFSLKRQGRSEPSFSAREPWCVDVDKALLRAQVFSKSFAAFATDPNHQRCLALELGSEKAAKAAISDVLASIPSTEDEWLKLLRGSLGTNDLTQCHAPKKWLAILPGNHPVVGIYPLAAAYVAGLEIAARTPTGYENVDCFFSKYARLLTSLPESFITILPSSFRIEGEASINAFDAVIAYGDNETLNQFRAFTEKPLVLFGESACVSFLNDQTNLDALMKDAFSLAQRGCMSPRALIAFTSAGWTKDLISASLNRAFISFWGDELDLRARISLDEEQLVRHLDDDAVAKRNSKEPLLLHFKQGRLTNADFFSTAFAFPILLVPTSLEGSGLSTLRSLINEIPQLRYVTGLNDHESLLNDLHKTEFSGIIFSTTGHTGRHCWDGTHERHALFVAANDKKTLGSSVSQPKLIRKEARQTAARNVRL